MTTFSLSLAIAGSFFLGSIPFGIIVGRLFFRTDIRKTGSGNIGAANALRTLGKAGGAAVLLLDLSKGLIPTLVALRLNEDLALIVAGAAIAGHCFSPWLGFRGGKGVATMLGALIALSWQSALISALVWLAVVRVTRYSSLASMAACASAPMSLWLFTHSLAQSLFGAAAALFVVWKHRENIQRLREGRENTLAGVNVPRT